MELHQIEAYIDSSNPQDRMKAITELRNYEPHVVVPLLKRRIDDQKFMVRSLVASGLGFKRTKEGFDLLQHLIENDSDHNVRAEAANSLAKYGETAIPHLVNLFRQDSNWLVRYSILAAMDFTQYPETLLEFCTLGLEGKDPLVRLTVISSLGELAKTSQADSALELLLSCLSTEQGTPRVKIARALKNFEDPRAKAALDDLRQDPDHRVVGATLEGLV